MIRLPTVFVSHGSPMLALDAGPTGVAWKALAGSLPRPRAVLVVSSHWSASLPTLGSAARPRTIHDFSGFPAALYQIRYEPPGDPLMARYLAEGLAAAGWPTRLDPERGLDHGAWVPLRSMYPAADVPVLQLSIDARRDPAWHHELGKVLAECLPNDVLLIASGSLTHNLYDFSPGQDREPPPAYVTEFQQWFFEHLTAGDLDALLDYRAQAPHAKEAHPTDEHLLPLYVALGAAGDSPQVKRHYDAITERILAMDIYTFGNLPS